MKVIIVEDDYMQSQLLNSELSSAFKNVSATLIETESEFRERILDFEINPPDLFIIDIMLRWTDSSSEITEDAPNDVLDEGFYTAGLRCQKIIAASKTISNVPVILYSVVDKSDVKDKLLNENKNVFFLAKDKEFATLIELISNIISSH